MIRTAKRCPKCGETKPLGEFYTMRNDETGAYCKPCTKADVHRWIRENPERFQRNMRRSVLKRRYGLTEDGLEQMLTTQGGLCPICGAALNDAGANVDHNHETGKIRGLLCDRCNRTLGLFGDNAARLRRAAAYLRKADKPG